MEKEEIMKLTPQEVADFLGKPIAKDHIKGIARWFWYEEIPIFVSDPDWQFCGWASTKQLQELPPDLIEYDGTLEDSLTIPKQMDTAHMRASIKACEGITTEALEIGVVHACLLFRRNVMQNARQALIEPEDYMYEHVRVWEDRDGE